MLDELLGQSVHAPTDSRPEKILRPCETFQSQDNVRAGDLALSAMTLTAMIAVVAKK